MSSGPVWPNLFVIGAPRAGSTAVYFYLQQHPEVYMTPAKEPGFFAIGGELFDLEHRHTATPAYFLTTIESYQALFRHRTVESVIGDASPQYLFHPRAALRIRHYSRDAKIVAILRSPAARMYSHYMMGVRDGGQHGTFESAVQEAREKHPTPPLLANSYYYDALRLYCYLFPPDQLRVILYDDLSANATMVMQSLYRFLDVDHRFAPDTSVRPNRSGVPKSRIVHTMVMTAWTID